MTMVTLSSSGFDDKGSTFAVTFPLVNDLHNDTLTKDQEVGQCLMGYILRSFEPVEKRFRDNG